MRLQPGDTAPKSGEYKRVEADGKTVGTVHVKEGDRMPPTQSKTQHYEIE